eukprot:4645573-Pyramimonas_sp.AAC.1
MASGGTRHANPIHFPSESACAAMRRQRMPATDAAAACPQPSQPAGKQNTRNSPTETCGDSTP